MAWVMALVSVMTSSNKLASSFAARNARLKKRLIHPLIGQQVRSGLVFETTGYHVVGGVSIAIKKSDLGRGTESDLIDVLRLNLLNN